SMIASNRTAWINMMLVDEYGLSPTPPDPVTAAISTFIAFLTAGFVPLLPFLMAIPNPFAASAIATLAVFFLIGAAKSKWSNAHWSLCGLETLAIGAVTAGIAYAAGALLHLVAPL
ncbi:MAG: VIT1/CCC1 transporter family protein, partial [Pseudomonadota bacterium]